MRVVTVRANGTDYVEAGLVGQRSEQFRQVSLTSDDISNLTIADAALSYDGDGRLLRIGLQAYALGIAYEFDPYFGLSISRVDPLPHQLEAVYEHLLKLPTVRFLLADDAGAGKTIMAGLSGPRTQAPGPHRTGTRRLSREPDVPVAARAQGKVRREVPSVKGQRHPRSIRCQPVAGAKANHHLARPRQAHRDLARPATGALGFGDCR